MLLFALQSTPDSLTINLGADHGSFVISKEEDTSRLVLFSPFSGTSHKYSFDPRNEW